jgi:2'-5' RNA ligase
MRIFVGVELPEPVRDAAVAEIERLRSCVRRGAPAFKLRWVAPSSLHLTLWFLGELTDAACDAVQGAMSEPWLTGSFRLQLGGAGMFPDRGLPRILWLGLREGADGCRSLRDELASRFAKLGITPESREYSPHLTVARVKDVGRPDLAPVRGCIASVGSLTGSGVVSRVTLFESRLAPAGSQYEPLLHVPLK